MVYFPIIADAPACFEILLNETLIQFDFSEFEGYAFKANQRL